MICFGPVPVIVNDFQDFGRDDFICLIPSGVISSPPKPMITLCKYPPAPVAKYGLVPPLVSAITLKGRIQIRSISFFKPMICFFAIAKSCIQQCKNSLCHGRCSFIGNTCFIIFKVFFNLFTSVISFNG